MKKANEEKTNVQRLLDSKKIEYIYHSYADNPSTNGVEIARLLGEDERMVFKTLVTVGRSKEHYVFMIPVAEELDLKKAAAAANEKSIEMIAQKELLPLTGYVHGGCSPIGMKKQFKTFIHSTAEDFDTIIFSAGKVGYQVELPLEKVREAVRIESADLIVGSASAGDNGDAPEGDMSGDSKIMSSGEIRFKCPCCGCYTFKDKPDGNYDICPVCYWEDDPIQLIDEDYEGGANKVSLNQARINYLEFGACEESMKGHVRKPTDEEKN